MKALQEAVAQVSPAIGIQFRLLSAQLQESLLRERLMATLSSGFAVLAVLLSMLGLYGVIAYMVARRRNEIGVRIALGADRGRVIRLVLRETVVLLAVGLALGIGIALWAGRAAATLLYGLPPADPVSLRRRRRPARADRPRRQLRPRPPGGRRRAHGRPPRRVIGRPASYTFLRDFRGGFPAVVRLSAPGCHRTLAGVVSCYQIDLFSRGGTTIARCTCDGSDAPRSGPGRRTRTS